MLIKNKNKKKIRRKPKTKSFQIQPAILLGLLLLLEDKGASPPPAWTSWEPCSHCKTHYCHTAPMASESLGPEHSHMSLWTKSVKLLLLARSTFFVRISSECLCVLCHYTDARLLRILKTLYYELN